MLPNGVVYRDLDGNSTAVDLFECVGESSRSFSLASADEVLGVVGRD